MFSLQLGVDSIAATQQYLKPIAVGLCSKNISVVRVYTFAHEKGYLTDATEHFYVKRARCKREVMRFCQQHC